MLNNFYRLLNNIWSSCWSALSLFSSYFSSIPSTLNSSRSFYQLALCIRCPRENGLFNTHWVISSNIFPLRNWGFEFTNRSISSSSSFFIFLFLQSVTLHTNLGDIKCEIACDEVAKTAEVYPRYPTKLKPLDRTLILCKLENHALGSVWEHIHVQFWFHSYHVFGGFELE